VRDIPRNDDASAALGERALVVLGCRVSLDAEGRPQGALGRRVVAAAEEYARRGEVVAVVVASGGRRWSEVVEADAMARELARLGVPPELIVRERCSLSTRDNARFAAAALERRGITRATVVTCAWHLPRAVALFAREGMEADGLAAPEGRAPWRRRFWRWGRETVLTLLAAAVLLACSRAAPTAPIPADASATPGVDLSVVARAEDLRRARMIALDLQRDHSPLVRREVARALARILDADDAPLLRALEDDDAGVVAWAAYGLGESCRGHEEVHVQALSARLVSLDPGRPVVAPVDARVAILRALGRCGGDVAEQTLRAWLRRTDAALPAAEAAAFALGDVASKRGSLSLESTGALLEAAQRSPPVDAALYPFGRTDSVAGDELSPRLLAAARAAIGRPGASRFFAVRALGRAGADGAPDLARILASADFTPAERAEAARALARLHKLGQGALADGLAALVPEHAEAVAGDLFGVLLVAVESVADEPPKKTEAPLWALARLEPPPGAPPMLARRASSLRCTAAEKLARGSWDADVLRACDVSDGEAGEVARLAALDRGELSKSRRAPWLELTQSKHVRVREAAIDAIPRHPELGAAALPVLAEALASSQAGVVATAADVVHAHPDRVYVLAASERRAALDPRAPPPTADPARELDAGVAKAMRAALAHPWSADLVETRVALLDASLALHLDEARPYAEAACHDPNATVRSRAAKALAAAGDRDATCPPPDKPGEPAEELGHELDHATRVAFDTGAGALGIRFDPALAPVAATRFVALARSGFYTGVIVHRVVPGFVVQLGDRGADGYGGSGDSLRCETSPVGFGALDVGVALAGRDTGSSQVFVTLARHPHLDGEYAWVGHADGDWNGVAEGDVVRAVHVEE
jgi:cyclophilin family peptidyl-prolyl cis-trans isomerase/vancomycin permeability regulator SanA